MTTATRTPTIVTAGLMADSLSDMLELDHGIAWHCLTCPMQSYWLFGNIAGARHDLLAHVLSLHADEINSVEAKLVLANLAEEQFREDSRLALAAGKEPATDIPFSPAEPQDIVCQLIDCDLDAAHWDRW
jgi:hypothetical protein